MKRQNSPVNQASNQVGAPCNGHANHTNDDQPHARDNQSKRKKIQTIQPFSSLSQSALQAQRHEQERLRRLGLISDPPHRLPGIVDAVNERTKVPASEAVVIIDSSSDEDGPQASSFKKPPSSGYHSSMSSEDGRISTQPRQLTAANLPTSSCIVIDSSSDEENQENNSCLGDQTSNPTCSIQNANQVANDHSKREKVKTQNHIS